MKGKVAFITGGSKGIGFGIAEALAIEGVNTVLTSRSQESAEKAAKAISKKYDVQSIGVEADVRHFEDLVNAVEKAMVNFGQIDYVIANAGLGRFGSVESLSLDDWHDVIDTNLTGVFYTIKSTE